MMCRPLFYKFISVEFKNVFLLIITFLFSIPMFIGALSRDVPFDDMSLDASKMLLVLFAFFILLSPWVFILIRYRRLVYAFKHGVTVSGGLKAAVNMHSPYSKFTYKFFVDGQSFIHNVDLILTRKVKEVVEARDSFKIIFDAKNNRLFIIEIYLLGECEAR